MVRAVVCLFVVQLAGCSQLLGITDPSARGDGGIDPDGGGDGGTHGDRLALRFGNFRLAQQQAVQLHVRLLASDGMVQDVTGNPNVVYATDSAAVATVDHGVVAGATPGTATITVSLGSAEPVTVQATVTGVVCHPVINELFTGDANGTSTSAADEWVELYNPCTEARSIEAWNLVYRSAGTTGTTGDQSLALLSGLMAPGDFRLYAGISYPGTADAPKWTQPSGMLQQSVAGVGLRSGPLDSGTLVDSVAYGAVVTTPPPAHPFIETSSAPMMRYGVSLARLPFDGNDADGTGDKGNNAADFMIVTTPTPRTANTP